MAERNILKQAVGPTPECLNLLQLEALSESGKSHSHLATCPHCQAELALLKSFEAAEPLAEEGAAVSWISAHLERQSQQRNHPSRAAKSGESWWSRTFGLPVWKWAVPVTAIAVLVTVIMLRAPREPELRAGLGNDHTLYRSQEVQLVAPMGEVARVPETLQWQAFPGSKFYKVVVMEVDRSELWSTRSTENSAKIPASLRAKMLPGKPILWQVTAIDEHSRVLATSQIQRFVSPRENPSERHESK
jgi:hypothetical protein